MLEAETMERTSGAKQAEAPQLLWHDDHPGVTAYLDRCQVDTPEEWVQRVWKLIAARRRKVGSVIEFGAGDGRFSCFGKFGQYVGYEVDSGRAGQRKLPSNAQLLNACAFSTTSSDADVCVGNPPYVRNQDLPAGWRGQVGQTLNARLNVRISGLANAWQYFFFQALASTRDDGLIALIVPYEWVSRPSSRALREFIKSNGWSVDVYRLPDSVFGRVLTTSSITVVDKAGNGAWRYFDTDESTLEFRPAKTASLGTHKVIDYARAKERKALAKRGLSPGTQRVFVLSEGERVRHGLQRGRDVVPAITTLRHVGAEGASLTEHYFERNFVSAGMRCWLVRTDKTPSRDLQLYLDNIAPEARNTATCNGRDVWWMFTMPDSPELLVSMGFRGQAPKCVRNAIGARAVGGVSGIYCTSSRVAELVASGLRSSRLRGRLVSYSTGLLKLEINQLNTLLDEMLQEEA